MESRNIVFKHSDGFNGKSLDVTLNGGLEAPSHDRMSMDGVIGRTALTLSLVTVFAAISWLFVGDITASPEAIGRAWLLAIGGSIVGLALSLVISFRKMISPTLVLVYSAVEGLFVGAFSKVIAVSVGDVNIVLQAVSATIVAFAVTLAAYKFFDIQVTAKFRRIVIISIFAFFIAVLGNFILSFTPLVDNGGLRAFNTLGLAVSGIAVFLAVLSLILDFDAVERGIEAGLPEREAWRAAFGLTVTLVWMYLEILRILAILRR